MEDFIKNIEKSRNTQEQLDYYAGVNQLLETNGESRMNQISSFPVYASRQQITSFLEKYHIYNLIKDVPGSIVECGVAAGFGLFSFAHFCSIFETYHYTRKVIGFDTFAGFEGITEQDKTSQAAHLTAGGLHFDSYKTLDAAKGLYDQNRALGHIPKIELIKGDISKTLPQYLEENPHLVVGLLYLDMDIYKPTLDTIKLLWDRVPRGGVIAFDEINHRDYPGETIAAIEAIGLGNLRLKRFEFSSMLSYAVKE